MKVCTKCHVEKPKSEFRKQAARPDGLQSSCRECARRSQNGGYAKYRDKILDRSKKHQANVRDWITEYKRSHRCLLCKEDEPVCLELHHVDASDKDFTIGDATGRSLESIKREIEKCVVVCRNCHTKIHAGLACLIG